VPGTINARTKQSFKNLRNFSKVDVTIESIGPSKDNNTLITVANKPDIPFMDWFQSMVITDLGCRLRARHW